MAFSHKDSATAGTSLAVRLIDIEELPATGSNVPLDIMGGATTGYPRDLDNQVAATTWFRIYNNTSPTLGTTQPDVLIQVAANTHSIWTIAQGLTLTAALTVNASDADGAGGVTLGGAGIDVKIVAV